MLFRSNDVVAVKVIHHDVSYHLLHQLVGNRRQVDGSIITGGAPAALLKDGANLGESPSVRDPSTGKRMGEDTAEDIREGTGAAFDDEGVKFFFCWGKTT
jgi:hypothetical protein